jgi:hypothetical protein
MPYRSPTPPPPLEPQISGETTWHALADGRPEVLLRCVGPLTFQLMREFFYRRPSSDHWYQINAHDLTADPKCANNSTDLASVPILFWWLIASYGHQTRAAIIHDQLYDDPDPARVDEANLVFRDALAESGVPLLRRWIMWAGVDAAGRFKRGVWSKLDVAGQFITALGFVLTALYWIFGWVWNWGPSQIWIIPPVLAAVGVVAWRKRWLVSALAIGLVLPPLLPELISRSILFGLEWVFLPAARRSAASRGFETPTPTLRRKRYQTHDA